MLLYLIMDTKKGKKFKTLLKVLRFIYGNYTVLAVSRDFLFLFSTAAEIYGISVLGKFIDATTKILLEWNSFDFKSFLTSDSFKYLFLIFILWAVTHICNQIRGYLYVVIYEKTWSTTQSMIIGKVANSNLQDVEKKDFQDKVAFAPAYSIERIIDVYDNFSVLISNTVRLISAFVLITQSVGVSALLLALFVLPEAFFIHGERRDIKEFRDNSIGKLRFLAYVQDLALTISNFLELRVNNIFSFLKRRYDEEYDEYLNEYFTGQSSFYKSRAGLGVFSQFLKYIYVVYVLAISVLKKYSFGQFKALFDYVDVAFNSTSKITDSVSIIIINLEYIDEFFDLIEYEGFGDRYQGKIKLGKDTPLLEFKNLNFAYPDDPSITVLKDINIRVEPGEKIAILGSDGSGKSTLVKILTGLYGVVDGGYFLDGNSTRELARGELKKKIAVVLQEFIDYHFSLKENIVISGQRKNVDNALYTNVSKIAQVDRFKKSVGLDDASLLGKTFASGKELSPGYWQRLAISRMLYRNRQLFIMDEPFTYIDDVSAERILDGILKFLGEGKSLIYITRSVRMLKKFDRIYYLHKGRIVEYGSWEELIKKKGKLYKEFLLQDESIE